MNDDSQDLEPIDLSAVPPGSPFGAPPTGVETIAVPSAWPPGWYADPWTAGQYRYWTGQTWSGETNRWGPASAAGAQSYGAGVGGAGVGGAPASGAVTDPWPSMPSTTPAGFGRPTGPGGAIAPGGWAPPPRRRGLVTAGVIALVVVLLAAGGIGYAINSGSHSKRSVSIQPTPTTQTPSTPSVPAAPPDPDRRVLNGLVVQQSDINPARTVSLPGGGNTVGATQDNATLDLCNGTFASERLRTARLQVVDADASGNESLSTEAVLYRDPAATAQAFSELRKVAASCPDKPVVSPIGEPTATTVFKAAPDAQWPRTPTVDRQAYSMVTTLAGSAGQGPQTFSSYAVYLRRGRVLLGLYFPSPTGAQPEVAGQRTVEGIVGVFEARMSKLDASVVNATQ